MQETEMQSKMKHLKHELVNSLAALRSVHVALQTRQNFDDADQLLINVIEKLDRLKREASDEEMKHE